MAKDTKKDTKKGTLIHVDGLEGDQIRTLEGKKRMIESMRMKMGIVTAACGLAEISRSRYYTWMKEDKVFSQIITDITEEAIDMVEGKMFQLINGVETVHPTATDQDGGPIIYETLPDKILIMFYLKTKGKHRGYIERQEIGFTPVEQITGANFKLESND